MLIMLMMGALMGVQKLLLLSVLMMLFFKKYLRFMQLLIWFFLSPFLFFFPPFFFIPLFTLFYFRRCLRAKNLKVESLMVPIGILCTGECKTTTMVCSYGYCYHYFPWCCLVLFLLSFSHQKKSSLQKYF